MYHQTLAGQQMCTTQYYRENCYNKNQKSKIEYTYVALYRIILERRREKKPSHRGLMIST